MPIHDISVDSVCTVVEDAFSAPMCTTVITLRIGQCGTDRRLQGSIGGRCLTGTINASGIGPSPYVIDGGAGDFIGAFGEFESAFAQSGNSVVLADVKFEVCHYDKRQLF